jgi:hypothetical protein
MKGGPTKEHANVDSFFNNKKVVEQLKNAGLLDFKRSRRNARQLPQAYSQDLQKRIEQSVSEDQSVQRPDVELHKNVSLRHLDIITETGIEIPSGTKVVSHIGESPLNSNPLRVVRGETMELAIGSTLRERISRDKNLVRNPNRDSRRSPAKAAGSVIKNELDTKEHRVTMMVSQLWDNQFRTKVMGNLLDQSKRALQTTFARKSSITEIRVQEVIFEFIRMRVLVPQFYSRCQ